MKHIVMIVNDTTFAYNLRREILQRFLAEGYRVTLIGEVILYADEFAAMGCRVIDVHTGRHGTSVLQDVKLFFAYLDILRREKPDLVLTNNIKPNVYAGMVCRILGIRYIPNITGLGTAVEFPGKLQKLTTFLYKIGVAGASAVLFQNAENQQFFKERKMLGKNTKEILLPGSGVNLQSHPVLPYPQGDELHFLFVARVMREKGIDLYLAAAQKIRKEYPNAYFHVCGGCDDARYVQILQDAQAEGTVIYHGHQKDMIPFLQQSCCLVHPSYYPEGMSNVLLEAAASGRPLIATDRSGCRETVDAGVSGYVIPIQDEDALVAALKDFLSLSWEERRNMGLAGRRKIEREYDRQIVVQMYLNEINNIF